MKRLRHDDEAARAVAHSILGYDFAQPFMGMVIEDDGTPVGALIFNGYTAGRNIDLTGAGRGIWTVPIVRQVARYCFARVKRVTALTSVNNLAAIRALEAAGFKREGVMRDYFQDGDAVVLGLLKSEQKLVKVN